MAHQRYSGAIPDDLNIRLQQRDTSPLPAEALVRVQVINRGQTPQANYRWVLYKDGRWFLNRHSNDFRTWQTPFDSDLPTAPTQILPASRVAEVETALRRADFANQPPYQEDRTAQDGSYIVVTARLDGAVHEVIYNAVYNPLVDYLREFITYE